MKTAVNRHTHSIEWNGLEQLISKPNQIKFAFTEDHSNDAIKKTLKSKRTGAFTDNMSLPVHRWFRYSAGFSAEWVESVISQHHFSAEEYVFDPFVGSGTTLLAAQSLGVPSAGTEHHQFVYRIAKAKLAQIKNSQSLFEEAQTLLEKAVRRIKPKPTTTAELLVKCYTREALCKLEALRDAFYDLHPKQGPREELLWLAITAILRECSKVGTAQWQYVLPNKKKVRVKDPFLAFIERIKMFCADIEQTKKQKNVNADVLFCDARNVSAIKHLNGKIKLVVTSPPYPNNYDYADSTRLEMMFWGEIGSWGDLQAVVRHRLIRSCSQHSAAEKLSLVSLLSDPVIAPIREELSFVCGQLETIRQNRGGKKTYHTMVAAYFVDLARTWIALRALCIDGSKVCFVVGDSAPYGIYVPVERWLGDLALAAGFKSWAFEKIRDRNIKWKNRKHRVPLKEGNLWVEG